MAELIYNYTPVYGVEPYLDNDGAGGARVTGDNLIITMWSVANKKQPPNFSGILKPNTINELAQPAQRAAAAQAMHSRHSAFFYFAPEAYGDLVPKAGDILWPVMAVVNPPPELKQQLVGAVEFNGGNPADIASYTVKKSLQGLYAWTPALAQAEVDGDQNVWVSEASIAAFSDYIPLVNAPGTPIPFLATSGADGAEPTFFDRSTVQGVNQMIEAVNDGEFYIAYYLGTVLDIEGAYSGFRWPHSTARA